MILLYWLDQPVWLMFGMLVALVLGASPVLWLLANWRAPRPALLRHGIGILAPYFGSVSVLLALLAGFVAGDA